MAEILAWVLVLSGIADAVTVTMVRRIPGKTLLLPGYHRRQPDGYLVVHRAAPSRHLGHGYRAQPTRYREAVSNEVDDSGEEGELPVPEEEGGGSFPTFGRESPFKPERYRGWAAPTVAAGTEGTTFRPVQTYLQVRQTNRVKHVPQSEALEDATTAEEVANAPRLKELLRTTRVREVYSEEGYEDAGYDHGGHVRHAEHDEGFVARDEGVIKIKENVREEDYEMPEESKIEAQVARGEFEYPKYKGEHKYSSRIRSREEQRERQPERTKYIRIISSEEPARPGQRAAAGNGTKRDARKPGTKAPKQGPRFFRPTAPREPAVQTEDPRIILPTIGYINSLTTAHFGTGKTPRAESDNLLTSPLNLTEALNYLRGRRRKVEEGTKATSFEAMKLKKRGRREADEDVPDDGEEVHARKNEEIAEEEKERVRTEKEERREYERKLREEIDRERDAIIEAALREVPKFPREELEEEEEEAAEVAEAEEKPVDVDKYPFYYSRSVHEHSPLRYATNPKNYPRKTGRGMEFYEHRDRLVRCPEVAPDLTDIPRRNATLESETDRRRLGDLGEKIACLRAKYFDEDPLDNPLFREREIAYVGKSTAKAEAPAKFRYHSSYEYRPGRTISIVVRDRVIPVTEAVDESPAGASAPRAGELPPQSEPSEPAPRGGRENSDIECCAGNRQKDDGRRLPTAEKANGAFENSTRRRRSTSETGADRPLRLSLKEFFLLLQGNNERRISPKPFRLPGKEQEEASQEDAVVRLGGQYIKGYRGRELVYVRADPEGPGRWLPADVAQESGARGKPAKKPLQKAYKKYGKGKFY